MREENKSIDRSLQEFTPRPAPPGLRGRVLAAAEATRKNERFFSPGQRRAAAAFGLLILAVFAGDAVSAGQSAREMRWILAGTEDSPAEILASNKDLMREISGEDRNLGKWIAERMTAEERSKVPTRPAIIGGSGNVREVDDVL